MYTASFSLNGVKPLQIDDPMSSKYLTGRGAFTCKVDMKTLLHDPSNFERYGLRY